jgi:hypothetical protein
MPAFPEPAQLWCLINSPLGALMFSLFDGVILIRVSLLFLNMPPAPPRVVQGNVNIRNRKVRRVVGALMVFVFVTSVLAWLFALGTYQMVSEVGSCEDAAALTVIENWCRLYWMVSFGVLSFIGLIPLERKYKAL